MRTFLFLSILALLHAYVAARLGSFLERRFLAWLIVGTSFLLLVGSQFAYRHFGFEPDAYGLQYVSFLAYFLAGVLATLICVFLPLDILYLIGSGLRRVFGISNTERWVSLFWTVRLTLVGLAFFGALVGLVTVLVGPKVKQVRVVHAGLPADLEGFRIVQITDLHVGPTVVRQDVQRVVDLVNEQAPDLIAFTGDLADGFVGQLARHTEPLSGLRAKYGIYAVTGNHEYYWGAPEWIARMEAFGMKVLNDAHAVIAVGSAKLLIGGVPDTQADRFLPEHVSDPVKSIADAPAGVGFKLLLAHRPSSVFRAAEAGYDLQLSGHTHGGQFIPWSFFVPFAHPYTRGLSQHGSLQIYVSTGTQYWGPPNRLGIPGEITVLTLSARPE
ncbi:MAG: hypothetical protein A2X94_14775 [Bdellovibrionales bacterium GWB1_55_8]|nr:MAG: hypothetical protein A2X94_14775 [Bdellovibrionales bacterium GWB1_55_8]